MNCSPCGLTSNYSSVSTIDCVKLCGAGISTNTTTNVFVTIPSTVSTFLTNSSINVTLQPNANTSTIGTVAIQDLIVDNFSRIQTVTPTTMIASHVAFTPQLEVIGYASTGTGTINVDLSNSIVYMSTTGAGASRAFRQTLEYQLYQPGKDHQGYFTVVPQLAGTFDNSVAVRWGIYDDYRDKNTPAGVTGAPPYLYQSSINGGLGQETSQPSMGHYFELSGNQWFVVARRNSPNNVTNVVRIPQSNWNMDTMNPAYGNNPSGLTLYANRENLFFIERQWLGVGTVKMGIYYKSQEIVFHEFTDRGLQRPYTHLNKLPLRAEIEKVPGGSADPAVTGSMCLAGHIDGDYTPIGAIFSLPVSVISPTTRIQTTERPVLLLRLQQRYCRATFKIKDIELFCTNPGIFGIYKNPTITGPITWVNHPDPRSMMQYAVFANGTTEPSNTISGGQCIQTGFFSQRSVQVGPQSVADLIAAPSFCSDIKGKPDIFCITMTSSSGNIDINATCRWLEIV